MRSFAVFGYETVMGAALHFQSFDSSERGSASCSFFVERPARANALSQGISEHGSGNLERTEKSYPGRRT
ncbi:MAG: hypothetical protein GY711_30500 [bacterium]|nr:hypothetical protein [bacterium]